MTIPCPIELVIGPVSCVSNSPPHAPSNTKKLYLYTVFLDFLSLKNEFVSIDYAFRELLESASPKNRGS